MEEYTAEEAQKTFEWARDNIKHRRNMKQLKERMATVALRQRGRAAMAKPTEHAAKLPPQMRAHATEGRKESMPRTEPAASTQQPPLKSVLPPIAGSSSRSHDRGSSRAVDVPWHARAAAERLSAVEPVTSAKDDLRRLDALLSEAAESHAARMQQLHHQFKAAHFRDSPLPQDKTTDFDAHGPSFRPESRSLRSGKGKRAPSRGDGVAEGKPQSARMTTRLRAEQCSRQISKKVSCRALYLMLFQPASSP